RGDGARDAALLWPWRCRRPARGIPGGSWPERSWPAPLPPRLPEVATSLPLPETESSTTRRFHHMTQLLDEALTGGDLPQVPLIVSVDDHIVEPPGLWVDRLTGRFR